MATELLSPQSIPITDRKNATKSARFDAHATHPNAAGLTSVDEVLIPMKLVIKGKIPDYVRGVLYRTGPGKFDADTRAGKWTVQHWFENGVSYTSKFACDAKLQKIIKEHNTKDVSFAQKDPCESMFSKMFSIFEAASKSNKTPEDPSDANVGVTLSYDLPQATTHRNKPSLFAKTDANILQELDPDTLEPIALARYADLSELSALKGAQLSAAHARIDRSTNELFNFGLHLGPRSKYIVFKQGSQSKVLAEISTTPNYLHSMFLTDRYVILANWQATIMPPKVLYNRNILNAIQPWNPKQDAIFYVISRDGGIVNTFKADAFFCFHTINAYEEDDDIVLELSAYDNHSVLSRLYVEFFKSNGPNRYGNEGVVSKACLRQYRLSNITPKKGNKGPNKATLQVIMPEVYNIELPVINPEFSTKKNNYSYGIHSNKSMFANALIKIDSQNRNAKRWEEPGKAYTPSEPIFVRNPSGNKEDDGVLLSVVLDGFKGKSFLLILDASDMTEVARADMDVPVPFGFHGTFANQLLENDHLE